MTENKNSNGQEVNDLTEVDNLAEYEISDPKVKEELGGDQELDKKAANMDASMQSHPATDPEAPNGSPADAGFLIGLAKWRPFMAYFLFLADCKFPKTMPPHERLRGCAKEHHRIFLFCRVADLMLIVGVIAFLTWFVWRVANNALA